MKNHTGASSFEPLELAEKVLSSFPDLEMTFFSGLQARRAGLKYPIERHEDLKILFGDDGKAALSHKGHSVTYAQVVEFLPKEFFPIEDEDNFLRRVLIAFQRETLTQRRPLDGHTGALTAFVDPAFASAKPHDFSL